MPNIMVRLTDKQVFELLKKTRAESVAEAVYQAIKDYLDSTEGSSGKKSSVSKKEVQKILEDALRSALKEVSFKIETSQAIDNDLVEKEISSLKKRIETVEDDIEDLEEQIKELPKKINVDNKHAARVVELDVREIAEKKAKEEAERLEVIFKDYIDSRIRWIVRAINEVRIPKIFALQKELNEIKELLEYQKLNNDEPIPIKNTPDYQEDKEFRHPLDDSLSTETRLGIRILNHLNSSSLIFRGIAIEITGVWDKEHLITFKIVPTTIKDEIVSELVEGIKVKLSSLEKLIQKGLEKCARKPEKYSLEVVSIGDESYALKIEERA